MKDRRITRTKKAIQNAYLDMLKKKGTEKIRRILTGRLSTCTTIRRRTS